MTGAGPSLGTKAFRLPAGGAEPEASLLINVSDLARAGESGAPQREARTRRGGSNGWRECRTAALSINSTSPPRHLTAELDCRIQCPMSASASNSEAERGVLSPKITYVAKARQIRHDHFRRSGLRRLRPPAVAVLTYACGNLLPTQYAAGCTHRFLWLIAFVDPAG
eukprot:scaffold137283_cov27-Tisochrysis_lutea.AAC.1